MRKAIYVSKSRIHGKGLFAGRAFGLMEVVYQPQGKIVHAREINWETIEKNGYDDFVQVGSWKYLDARDDSLFNAFARNLHHFSV